MKVYPADKIRNITLLGHSGSGKTSVVEALLYNSKAIDRMGKVADGNTVTDFDPEEIRRGISINSSYAAVEWKDHKINLIDCPGDFDFLGEQTLGTYAGDSILLVLSAKDGLSVGAEKTMRLAEKKNIPMALAVNRLDEPNADFEKVVADFREKYGKKIVPLAIPIMDGEVIAGVIDVLKFEAYSVGSKQGQAEPMDIPAECQDKVEGYHTQLMEAIAESDEELMEKFFAEEPFTKEESIYGLRDAIRTRSLIPVFAISAIHNLGTNFLLDNINNFFPSAAERPAVPGKNAGGEVIELQADTSAPLAAWVFKTIVDPFVGRISLLRVFSGTLKNEPLYNFQKEKEERINGLFVLRGKKQIEVDEVLAGDIAALTKLQETSTNETLTNKDRAVVVEKVELPQACLTRAIIPAEEGAEDRIMQGLNKIADEDPSFTVENNKETHQLLLSGLGEIQLDVLCEKLKGKFSVEAKLEEPKVAYRETIRKQVKVQGRHKKQSGGHGQFGDVWIVFEPGESDELEFAEEIFGGAVPKNYFPAVEKGLQEAVEEGVLAGYPVVNLKATLVDGSYHDVDSNEMSFKMAARLAYKAGLPQADPVLLEPIASVKVHIPEAYLGDVMGDMSKRRGRILGMGADENVEGFQVVDAEAPQAELSKYATDLRSMTQGHGWFTIEFARYEQAPSDVADKVIAAAAKNDEA